MSKTHQHVSDNTALIIVDVQNGVLGKDNATYQSEILLSNLEYIIEKGRKADIPIIYVQHNEEKQLVSNTSEWEIHDKLAPKSGDIRIQKHHPSSFHDTDLEEQLLRLGVNRLVIGGLQTEWCIDSTVRHAYSLGFEVIVVEDGHSTTDSSILRAEKIISHHNRVFGGGFARVKLAHEIEF